MDMKTMERLEKRLCAELDEIAGKPSMSSGDLDVVDKATHSLKSMAAIKMSDGASGAYYEPPMQHYDNGTSQRRRRTSYDDGMSYNTREATYGRYSQGAGPEEMREDLRRMLESGTLTPQQREAAHRLMDALAR